MAAPTHAEDERTPLLSETTASPPPPTTPISPPSQRTTTRKPPDEESQTSPPPHPSVTKVILILLIGIFISNADTSILLATHPIISSSFNALHDSSYLLTSFGLAGSLMQPIYGKTSDIFGRKSLLLIAYALFGVGCAIVGGGQSMAMVILGRVVSGLGAAGMTGLVSILITDLVPLRDVASWRSYVNIAATTGRSVGGPLGGLLADTVGWRWSFLGQCPVAMVAIFLIATVLPEGEVVKEEEGRRGRLGRVDFLGAGFLTMTLLCFLLPLQIGGDRLPWGDPVILGLFGGAVVFGVGFVVVEGRFAREPIIPLGLFRKKDVVLSSLVMIVQGIAQIGVCFPLFVWLWRLTLAAHVLHPYVFSGDAKGIEHDCRRSSVPCCSWKCFWRIAGWSSH